MNRHLALAIICWPPLCGAMQLIPEFIPPPIPEEAEYIRTWNPAHIAALDELIHADTLAGKYPLPTGYTARDGGIWYDKKRLPKSWAAKNAGCVEIPAGPGDFGRKSYFVPLDVYERYEKHFED